MTDVFISLGLGNVPLHVKPGWLHSVFYFFIFFSNKDTSSLMYIIVFALFSVRGCDSCIDRGCNHRLEQSCLGAV